MILLRCIFLLSLWSGLFGDDWPNFRGPNGAGVADNSAPPIRFGMNENMLWKRELPSGHSSPVISNGSLFLTTFEEESPSLNVVALDQATGNIRWTRSVPFEKIERGHPSFNPASSTPATDGQHVVAYFGSYGLVCFDFEGNQIWDYPLPLTKSYAGNAISPIIVGNKVILYRGNFSDHFLVALNKANGQELWKTEQSEPFHAELACTGMPIVHDDLLILHGARSVQGFDLETGKQRWITKCATTATSTPVIAGNRVLVAAWNKMGEPALRPEFPAYDELVSEHDRNEDGEIQASEFPRLWIFHRPEGAEAPENGATISFRSVDRNQNERLERTEWERQLKDLERFRQGYQTHGLLSLPLAASGVLSESDVVTLETQGIPEVPSPISDGRHVYLVKNGGLVTCIDLETGERVYRKRTGGRGTHYASPIIAGGHLYVADGRGQIAVLTLGEQPEVVALNSLNDPIYATPAVSGDVLYIRSHSALWAFARSPK